MENKGLTGWFVSLFESKDAGSKKAPGRAAQGQQARQRPNRRGIGRVPAGFEVRCRIDGRDYTAKALDISPTGIQLNSSRIEKANGDVYLMFSLPGILDQKPARAIGKVVRMQPGADGRRRFGISFEALQREARVAICEYVAKMATMYQDFKRFGMGTA